MLTPTRDVLPTSRTTIHRVSPFGMDPNDSATPIYLLRAPGAELRAMMNRDIAAKGARRVTDGDLFAALRKALRDLCADDVATEHAALVDEYEAALTVERQRRADELAAAKRAEALKAARPDDETVAPEPEPVAPRNPRLDELMEEVGNIEAFVLDRRPSYASLKAAQQYFMQIVPLVVSRYVLVGWEQRDEKFRTGGDGLVHPEALATVPDDHRELIGWEGWSLAYLTPEQRGN